MSLIGCRVQIPCVTLYRDYEGNEPWKTISGGIYKCDNYKPENIAPIHIENLVGLNVTQLGWLKHLIHLFICVIPMNHIQLFKFLIYWMKFNTLI